MNTNDVQKQMVAEALRTELHNVRKEEVTAQAQFDEAHGLFIEAFAYKLKYLQVYYNAILEELRKL